MMILQLVISLFLCSYGAYADDNNSFISGMSPTLAGDEPVWWTANLNSLFSSLEANVTANSGFYEAEAGEDSDKIYGLIQCRGDINPSQCRECTTDSFSLATDQFGGSTSVVIWQNWCYLRYSDVSFYGVWEGSGPKSSYGSDDSDVAVKGMAMMAGLAASAPNETLNMFDKSEMDDGKGGKRYGLAQCSRDLQVLDCGDCLDCLLNNFTAEIANKRRWQKHVVGCFMMYDDSQFYFDTSLISAPGPLTSAQSPPDPLISAQSPPRNAANIAWAGRLALGVTIFATAMLAYL